MTRTVRIRRERLWSTLMELKEIGGHDDEATGPREHLNPDACGNGTDVLANAVLRLANQA